MDLGIMSTLRNAANRVMSTETSNLARALGYKSGRSLTQLCKDIYDRNNAEAKQAWENCKQGKWFDYFSMPSNQTDEVAEQGEITEVDEQGEITEAAKEALESETLTAVAAMFEKAEQDAKAAEDAKAKKAEKAATTIQSFVRGGVVKLKAEKAEKAEVSARAELLARSTPIKVEEKHTGPILLLRDRSEADVQKEHAAAKAATTIQSFVRGGVVKLKAKKAEKAEKAATTIQSLVRGGAGRLKAEKAKEARKLELATNAVRKDITNLEIENRTLTTKIAECTKVLKTFGSSVSNKERWPVQSAKLEAEKKIRANNEEIARLRKTANIS